jgi:hypothetical protein
MSVVPHKFWNDINQNRHTGDIIEGTGLFHCKVCLLSLWCILSHVLKSAVFTCRYPKSLESSPQPRKCGNLNISEPYGPPRLVTGIPLLFYFYNRPVMAAVWSLTALRITIKNKSFHLTLILPVALLRSDFTTRISYAYLFFTFLIVNGVPSLSFSPFRFRWFPHFSNIRWQPSFIYRLSIPWLADY